MNNYEKLKRIIDEIDSLRSKKELTRDPEFKAWKAKAERFIAQTYGKDSIEYENFSKIRYMPTVFGISQDISPNYHNGLQTAKLTLQEYLDDLDTNIDVQDQHDENTEHGYNKVFIVHGHDEALKHSIARIIEKQGIEAIILSEKTNQGKTIIEKFEAHSDAGGAICLFTADDMGKAKAETTENSRARQNVVFEAGYFMGKLGRNHVVIICEAGVELPGDLSGVVYTSKSDWKTDVLRELKAMGYSIDMNKLFE